MRTETEALLRRTEQLERELLATRQQLVGLSGYGSEEETRGGDSLAALICDAGGQLCAIPAHSVQEVVPIAALSPIPNAPPWLSGSLDVAGDLVPVLDLGLRLGLDSRKVNVGDAIVLCEVEDWRVGLVIRAVPGVQTIPSEAIDAPPSNSAYAPYVCGIVHVAGQTAFLLNLLVLLLSSGLDAAQVQQSGLPQGGGA